MSKELFFLLLAGTVLMCLPMAWQLKRAKQPIWKAAVLSAALVLTGYYGSQLWFFVENGEFGGRSFYGAVFLSPVIFWILGKLLRIPYPDAMDTVAPAGCLTLALVKLQCLRDNCCQGKILYVDEQYMHVRFPSQLAEMAAFGIIAVILFVVATNRKSRGTVFCWFMILYGASRFVLDFYREIETPWLLGLSAGSFWSACAFLIGVVSLIVVLRVQKKADSTKEILYDET